MTEPRERVFSPTSLVVHGNGEVVIHEDGKITGVDDVEYEGGVLSINRNSGGSSGITMSSSSFGGIVSNVMSVGNVTMSGGSISIDGMQITTAKGGTELRVKSRRLKSIVLNGKTLSLAGGAASSTPTPPPPRVRLDIECTSIDSITLNGQVTLRISTTKPLTNQSLIVSTNGSTTLRLPRGLRVQTLMASTNGSSDFLGNGVKSSGPVNLTSNGSSDIKGVIALAGGVASSNGSSDIRVSSNVRIQRMRNGTSSIKVTPITN